MKIETLLYMNCRSFKSPITRNTSGRDRGRVQRCSEG